jgi:hypothetical protein
MVPQRNVIIPVSKVRINKAAEIPKIIIDILESFSVIVRHSEYMKIAIEWKV